MEGKARQEQWNEYMNMYYIGLLDILEILGFDKHKIHEKAIRYAGESGDVTGRRLQFVESITLGNTKKMRSENDMLRKENANLRRKVECLSQLQFTFKEVL